MKPCKSFFNIGYSCKCLNCSYCVLKNTNFKQLELPYNKNIPIAVNMFYGDAMLQLNNTYKILDMLEQSNHKGVVFILTKADYTKFNIKKYNLDLHIAFSTFGIDSDLDGGSMKQFETNLEYSTMDNYSHSIEYRPIIKGINDDVTMVMKLAEKYNYPVAYGGLIERNKKVDKDIDLKIQSFKIRTYKKTIKLLEAR